MSRFDRITRGRVYGSYRDLFPSSRLLNLTSRARFTAPPRRVWNRRSHAARVLRRKPRRRRY